MFDNRIQDIPAGSPTFRHFLSAQNRRPNGTCIDHNLPFICLPLRRCFIHILCIVHYLASYNTRTVLSYLNYPHFYLHNSTMIPPEFIQFTRFYLCHCNYSTCDSFIHLLLFKLCKFLPLQLQLFYLNEFIHRLLSKLS